MNKDCSLCNGEGIINGWSNEDGDYDFDWCDCNPEHLTPDMEVNLDICMGCNENKVSWDALYCLTCYLANNAEINYDEIDQLWLTKENA